MNKIKYTVRRLNTEYKLLRKPDRKTLWKDTVRVVVTAAVSAVALKIVDTGFAALLGLFL